MGSKELGIHTNFTVTMILWPGEHTMKFFLNIEAIYSKQNFTQLYRTLFVRGPQWQIQASKLKVPQLGKCLWVSLLLEFENLAAILWTLKTRFNILSPHIKSWFIYTVSISSPWFYFIQDRKLHLKLEKSKKKLVLH